MSTVYGIYIYSLSQAQSVLVLDWFQDIYLDMQPIISFYF